MVWERAQNKMFASGWLAFIWMAHNNKSPHLLRVRHIVNEIYRIEKYGFKSGGLNKIGHKLLNNV